jgi:hypothetical protein
MFDIFRSNKNKNDEENSIQNNQRNKNITTSQHATDQKKNNRKSQSSSKKLLSSRAGETNATDESTASSSPRPLEEHEMNHELINGKDLKWYQGGIRKKYLPVIKWVGRVGFIAKGVVYGCIGVLTLTNLTGAWTPNGSQGNESPQVQNITFI